MVKILSLIVALFSLSACTTFEQWLASSPFSNQTIQAEHSKFSFNWQLAGDKRVAPFQVFDNGKQTWLQFQPGQNIPAIFELADKGERPLSYKRYGEYLILDGVWSKLSFRGGALSASATRQEHKENKKDPINLQSSIDTDKEQQTEAQVLPITKTVALSLEEAVTLPVADAQPLIETKNNLTESTNSLTKASFEAVAINLEPVFAINLSDQNIRKALQRWAQKADWTFSTEHWSVDVDIPISAEAKFNGTFKEAVQDLIAATELADRPLQPCFYSNRVLRVVPYSQACDRASRSAML